MEHLQKRTCGREGTLEASRRNFSKGYDAREKGVHTNTKNKYRIVYEPRVTSWQSGANRNVNLMGGLSVDIS